MSAAKKPVRALGAAPTRRPIGVGSPPPQPPAPSPPLLTLLGSGALRTHRALVFSGVDGMWASDGAVTARVDVGSLPPGVTSGPSGAPRSRGISVTIPEVGGVCVLADDVYDPDLLDAVEESFPGVEWLCQRGPHALKPAEDGEMRIASHGARAMVDGRLVAVVAPLNTTVAEVLAFVTGSAS